LHLQDEAWLYAIGRMKRGQNPAQVSAQLTLELQHWLAEHVPMVLVANVATRGILGVLFRGASFVPYRRKAVPCRFLDLPLHCYC
jgi:hypothetical protein